MNCEHYSYDPSEHDYCPDCGMQDCELLHVEKEVVELREENERLKTEQKKTLLVLRGIEKTLICWPLGDRALHNVRTEIEKLKRGE